MKYTKIEIENLPNILLKIYNKVVNIGYDFGKIYNLHDVVLTSCITEFDTSYFHCSIFIQKLNNENFKMPVIKITAGVAEFENSAICTIENCVFDENSYNAHRNYYLKFVNIYDEKYYSNEKLYVIDKILNHELSIICENL